MPTYVQTLLKISADPQCAANNVAQAAAIQLKVMTETQWRNKTKEQAEKENFAGFHWIIIPEDDKQIVRENILEAMNKCQEKKIIKQYVACITNIARFDYPTLWTSLDSQITQYLQNPSD